MLILRIAAQISAQLRFKAQRLSTFFAPFSAKMSIFPRGITLSILLLRECRFQSRAPVTLVKTASKFSSAAMTRQSFGTLFWKKDKNLDSSHADSGHATHFVW